MRSSQEGPATIRARNRKASIRIELDGDLVASEWPEVCNFCERVVPAGATIWYCRRQDFLLCQRCLKHWRQKKEASDE